MTHELNPGTAPAEEREVPIAADAGLTFPNGRAVMLHNSGDAQYDAVCRWGEAWQRAAQGWEERANEAIAAAQRANQAGKAALEAARRTGRTDWRGGVEDYA